MSDDLFTKDNPGELLKVGKASERLAEPGVTPDYAAGQLRGLAGKQLVRPSATRGEGKVIHNFYSLPDLAVVKILSILISNGGIAKPGMLEWVSDWLYDWPPSHPCEDRRYPSQTHAAMAGTARGEHWTCRVDVFAHVQTGAEMACAYLYTGEAPPIIAWELDNGPVRRVGEPSSYEKSDEHQFRLSITIPLFASLSRLLGERSEAN